MNHLPRIALGTVQSNTDMQLVLWALMNVLERSGLHVQSFSSQSRCDARDAALSITGQGRRHLDSWVMQPEIAADIFLHAGRCADIGIVDGEYNSAVAASAVGGSLDTLCEWLDLPQLAVVSASAMQTCLPPVMPNGLEGILLDNVASVEQLCHLQTAFEALYGVPVLGVMRRQSNLRAAVANLPPDGKPTPELCDALGTALIPHFDFDALLRIATQKTFMHVDGDLFRHRDASRRLSVAVAHDEAFSGDMPDTLDVLESQGATVNFFSPLRSEELPRGTDVVYLGSRRVECYVNELAANVCIKESLWNHVASGGRVYAESGGLAYLCREIVMPCGGRWPMVGLLPSLARHNPRPAPDRAVEIRMARGSWLFSSNETVRGYLSSKWIIHPDGCLIPLVSEVEHSHDVVGDYQIVGSRVHLNFAARPDCVDRFFQPCRSARLNTVT